MVCNVSNEENKKKIVNSISYKSPWIRDRVGKKEDFEVVAMKKTKSETQHYIIKCKPEIRKATYDAGDYV